MRKEDKVAVENRHGDWKRFLRRQRRRRRQEREVESEYLVSLATMNVYTESVRQFCGAELIVTLDEMRDLCLAFRRLPEDCQNNVLRGIIEARAVSGARLWDVFLRARQLVMAYEAYSRAGCEASPDFEGEGELSYGELQREGHKDRVN